MNEISKAGITLARRSFIRFKTPDLISAILTGSAAKGYADDYSDLDIILIYKNPLSNEEFERIVKEAKESGGDLYNGTPEHGFSVYYYIEGIKCDFAFGSQSETQKLFNEVTEDSDEPVDLIKHLQVSGFIDGFMLFDDNWLQPLIDKTKDMPSALKQKLVGQHLKFLPKWAFEKMAIERKDILFYYECVLEDISNLIAILCGLNGIYHPGKIKGAEFIINKMKIKPVNFTRRYKNIFKLNGYEASEELYNLINETLELIDRHLPEVSTERSKAVQKMVLRK